MKLEEAKTAFYDASDTLSENTRKLAFAGIAIIWVLKTGDKSAAGIPYTQNLLWPLGVFAASLAADVLQYLYKSTAWWLYFAFKHKNGVKDDTEVDPPGALNFFAFVLFYAKVLICGYGYYWLLTYIWVALSRTASG